jgi:hypothetical protein
LARWSATDTWRHQRWSKEGIAQRHHLLCQLPPPLQSLGAPTAKGLHCERQNTRSISVILRTFRCGSRSPIRQRRRRGIRRPHRVRDNNISVAHRSVSVSASSQVLQLEQKMREWLSVGVAAGAGPAEAGSLEEARAPQDMQTRGPLKLRLLCMAA